MSLLKVTSDGKQQEGKLRPFHVERRTLRCVCVDISIGQAMIDSTSATN